MEQKPQPSFNSEDVGKEIIEDSRSGADRDNADDYAWKKYNQEEIKAFHVVKLVCIYFVPSIAAITIVVFFANKLLPEKCRWLSTTELTDLQTLCVSIISGVATTLVVNYFYRNK